MLDILNKFPPLYIVLNKRGIVFFLLLLLFLRNLCGYWCTYYEETHCMFLFFFCWEIRKISTVFGKKSSPPAPPHTHTHNPQPTTHTLYLSPCQWITLMQCHILVVYKQTNMTYLLSTSFITSMQTLILYSMRNFKKCKWNFEKHIK